MKLEFYWLFLLVMLTPVIASNGIKLGVNLTVINNPSEVVSVEISEPLENENLRCRVLTKEGVKDVKIEYKWYKNNILITGQEGNILDKQFFKRDDTITCEVIPDDLTQGGIPKKVSVVIKPQPLISGITGAVVGLGDNIKNTSITLLYLLVMALIIFGIAYFLKRK